MAHFVGLDVSVKETSVCVVEDAGAVVCERRVGIEAGPLSQWLVNGLSEAGLPVICVETRHVKALLQAQQINKSDRNAARGIAQMMRVGLFKPVHVKTLSKYAASDTTAPNRSPAGRSGTPSRMVRLPCREIRGKACDRAGARHAGQGDSRVAVQSVNAL
jgi:hypothetical protein